MSLLNYLLPTIIILIFAAIGWLITFIINRYLVAWAKKTKTKVDDIIVSTLSGLIPIISIFLILGIYMSFGYLVIIFNIPEDIALYIPKILEILMIIVVILWSIKIVVAILYFYTAQNDELRPLVSVFSPLIQFLVLAVGIMAILNYLNISITPILAGLGVIGIVLGLALQETLTNLLAGFYIRGEKPVQVGHYIKIEDQNIEGYVEEMGWRSVKIRTLPNNIVMIGNSKFAQSTITDYDLPNKEMAVLVQVGVHYDSDLEKVEKITIEIGREVIKEIAKMEFEPFIRYHTFGDSSINFTVILRAKEYVDQHLIKHEFVKRLHKKFKEEGIVIPYPIRTVYLKEKNYDLERKEIK